MTLKLPSLMHMELNKGPQFCYKINSYCQEELPLFKVIELADKGHIRHWIQPLLLLNFIDLLII
jgi:hypothetical protein